MRAHSTHHQRRIAPRRSRTPLFSSGFWSRLLVTALLAAAASASAGSTIVDNDAAYPAFWSSGPWSPSTQGSTFQGTNHLVATSPSTGAIDNTTASFSTTGTWVVDTALSGYYGSNYARGTTTGNSFHIPEIVVDNTTNGAGGGQLNFSGGGWSVATTPTGYYGRDFAYFQPNVSTSSKRAVYSFMLRMPGNSAGTFPMNVFAHWPADPANASNAVVRIYSGDYLVSRDPSFLVASYTLNQRVASGTWFSLGTLNLGTSRTYYVEFDASLANGRVIADAIRLTSADTTPATVAKWLLPSGSGLYDVYARNPANPSLAWQVAWTLVGGNGAEYPIDGDTNSQRVNSGVWKKLGSIDLTGTQSNYVQLELFGGGVQTGVADAVLAVPTGTFPIAKWQAPVVGDADLWASWSAATGRNPAVSYTVTSYPAGCSATTTLITVDQTKPPPSGGLYLGRFSSTPPCVPVSVTLTTGVLNGGVMSADAVTFTQPPVLAALTATPDAVAIASPLTTGSSVLEWASPVPALLTKKCGTAAETSVSTGLALSGRQTVSALPIGTCTFSLRAGGTAGMPIATAQVQVLSVGLTATPNPVILAPAALTGTTSITWAATAEVDIFADCGTGATTIVSGVGGGTQQFGSVPRGGSCDLVMRLNTFNPSIVGPQAPGPILATLTVTGAAAAVPLPAPPVNTAPVIDLEYDAEGNSTKVIEAKGVANFNLTTAATYDSLNRAKVVTDAKSAAMTWGYDGADRTTQLSDPKNLLTAYLRNGLGQISPQLSPDTGVNARTYDAAGNLLTRTDGRGVVTTYAYDALSRLTKVSFAAPTGSETMNFTYDETGPDFLNGIGQLTSATYASGSSRFSYDANGRLLSETQILVPVSRTYPITITSKTAYTYDGAGNVTSITYPSGTRVDFSLVGGLPSQLSVSKGAAGPRVVMSSITWQPLAGLKSWKTHYANGTPLQERVYDSSGRQVRYQLGNAIRDLSYDAASRIVRYTHYDRSTSAALPALDQAFAYDAVGHLTDVQAGGSTWKYAYSDPNGSRTSVTRDGALNTFTVSPTTNRLLSTSSQTFEYDGAGNTTVFEGPTAATFSPSNRLVVVAGRKAAANGFTIVPVRAPVRYVFDAFGRRVRKLAGLGGVIFNYDMSNHLLGEYDSTGNAIREYVWLGSTPVAVLVPTPAGLPDVYFIHTDHLDAPQAVLDENQRVRWLWLTEPFGTTAPQTNPEGLGVFELNLRFPGQYADAETGLFFNGFRDYAPSLGRYIESDPVGLAAGVNTYSYVQSAPTNQADPLGLMGVASGAYRSSSSPRAIKPNTLAWYYGAEAHFIVGAGVTSVTCTDECGRHQTFRYSKACFGLAAGASFGGGAVTGMSGKACNAQSYKGWFIEFGASAGPLSGGVDFGYNDDGFSIGPLKLPGAQSGVNEASFGLGGFGRAGFEAKASYCYYFILP